MGSCSGNHRTATQKHSEIRQFSQLNIRNFYRLGQVIGKGNFAQVQIGYSLEQEKSGFKGKCYAIKCIDKNSIGQDIIQRELEILSRLDHPNIIRVFEEYEDTNHFYFVMEYCKGGELLQKILNHGKLPERKVQIIMKQLFSAVAYLHDHGIIHRDLKPENLMLASQDGELDIRIIDFGLSKRDQRSTKTQQQRSKLRHQTKVGTPIYVAPEVIKGVYSETCDEWSLGCIMYVLLCGEPPFSGSNLGDLEQKISNDNIKYPANISTECRDIIYRLLEKNPNKRMTCLQALQHEWLVKDSHLYRVLTTMQSEENGLEIEMILDLLMDYGRCTQFKKESLKILLSQLTDMQQLYLKTKFEELDKDYSGTINEKDLSKALEMFCKPHLIKKLGGILQNFSSKNSEFYVSYSDFMAALLNQPSYMTNDTQESVFRVFDIRHRYCITKIDYKNAMGRRGRLITDERVDYIFKEINLQMITFDQFKSMMTNRVPKRRHKGSIVTTQTIGFKAVKIPACVGDVDF